MVNEAAQMVKHACLETVEWQPISSGDRYANTAIRGVCPEYGEMRNEVPAEGRWISAGDLLERRRVAFIGGRIREKLFSGRPAGGGTGLIKGGRLTVLRTMDRKIQLSNYFFSHDESRWIPFTAARD